MLRGTRVREQEATFDVNGAYCMHYCFGELGALDNEIFLTGKLSWSKILEEK